ncbi:MAG: hypothetical protein H6617_01195 [Bdellovibrionaceae bacterium]|nr:hypothetical protein [Pseudobdellovibrionaceae bacterium]
MQRTAGALSATQSFLCLIGGALLVLAVFSETLNVVDWGPMRLLTLAITCVPLLFLFFRKRTTKQS